MIQGQINSMIAQIGGMAHLGKTLQNEQKVKDVELFDSYSRFGGNPAMPDPSQAVKTYKTKVKEYEQNLDDRYKFYGSHQKVNEQIAKDLILRTDSYGEQGFSEAVSGDWDLYKAGLASNLTARQVANMNQLRAQIRKPSTARAPEGNNNGNEGNNNGNGGNNNGN